MALETDDEYKWSDKRQEKVLQTDHKAQQHSRIHLHSHISQQQKGTSEVTNILAEYIYINSSNVKIVTNK